MMAAKTVDEREFTVYPIPLTLSVVSVYDLCVKLDLYNISSHSTRREMACL